MVMQLLVAMMTTTTTRQVMVLQLLLEHVDVPSVPQLLLEEPRVVVRKLLARLLAKLQLLQRPQFLPSLSAKQALVL